jgi:2-polyprenyl-6-methoxyphenol hydroxylase-like FAD-dependent oxidoreductase
MLIYPQDEHERLLIDRLAQSGIAIERSSELTNCEVREDCVRATLRRPNGDQEICAADFLAGCDGAHSTVRDQIGVGFPGGTYAHMFYVADVAATGPVMNGELHIALDEVDFLAVFPLRSAGQARLVGTVRQESIAHRGQLTWNDVSRTVIDRMGISIDRVNWFSTYHVHHRVAHRFCQGRVFLLGDAAHIHSPVGGQGMNTGIGDAVNLAWKLADVLHQRSEQSLLDTYEPERIAFAQRLVATTDRAFTLVTSPGRIARVVRTSVVPRLLPLLFRSTIVRRFMFRTVSQIAVNYRRSPLSQGAAGRVYGGDRLPWVPFDAASDDGTDNFAPLRSLNWQVHVYGTCPQNLTEFCQRHKIDLRLFPWTNTASRAGLHQNALYLIRPDGYIALVDPDANPATLEQYAATRHLRNFRAQQDPAPGM